MPFDVSKDIIARSDQLNADDLMGGPITVEITGVRRRGDDNKIAIEIAKSGHKPWMPCKTMLRVLSYAWGTDADLWIGRTLTLFREPAVRFGGEEVGGIRISAMSHIEKAIGVNLQIAKGKKSMHRVDRLEQTAPTVATLRSAIAAAMGRGWTREDVARVLGCDKADQVPEADREAKIAILRQPPPGREGGEE